MDNCRLRILSKHDQGFISMPEGQNIIHLCFNNILINFSKEDFIMFRKIVKDIYADNSPVAFPDGRERILLNSPYSGINFSFNHFEMTELVRSLDEAFYMERIYSFLQ
ncbi:Uncharacterised protein [Sphingobacterium mizutaii]|uniref:Uncharacterized protein n=2 Tax=Sphingobacterium mizutaii TaxID=1010 RepID=A0AAJ4X8N5_9SPHI|nr:DUF6686 family protein [Sphingobacterium mizutaii]SDL89631.1 hypothetical protein SAMN05192578_1163 [Sphingobacterium mizutaii]SNV40739.1 Uncharacterised protein [Sphingobacterium mizutaii]